MGNVVFRGHKARPHDPLGAKGTERRRATLYKRHQTWGERKQFRWHGKCQMNACNRGKGLLPGNARGGRERRSVCRRRRRSERRAAPSSFFTAVKGRARLAGEKEGERGGGRQLPAGQKAACKRVTLPPLTVSQRLHDARGPFQGGVVLFGDQHYFTN